MNVSNYIKRIGFLFLIFSITQSIKAQEVEGQEEYVIKLLKKFNGKKIKVIENELLTFDEIREIFGSIMGPDYIKEFEKHKAQMLDSLIIRTKEYAIQWRNIKSVDYKIDEIATPKFEMVTGDLVFTSNDAKYVINTFFIKYRGEYRFGGFGGLEPFLEDVDEFSNDNIDKDIELENQSEPDPNLIITDTSFYGVSLGDDLESDSINASYVEGVKRIDNEIVNVYFILDDRNRHIADAILDDDGLVESIEIFSNDVYLPPKRSVKYIVPLYLSVMYPEGNYVFEGEDKLFKIGKIYLKIGINRSHELEVVTKVIIKNK